MTLFLKIFSAILSFVYLLYFFNNGVVYYYANLHGHFDFVLGIALLSYVLKVTYLALVDTTPDAISAASDVTKAASTIKQDQKYKKEFKHVVQSLGVKKDLHCCSRNNPTLIYKSLKVVERVGIFQYMNKNGQKDQRRNVNPQVYTLRGFWSCNICQNQREFQVNFYYNSESLAVKSD